MLYDFLNKFLDDISLEIIIDYIAVKVGPKIFISGELK